MLRFVVRLLKGERENVLLFPSATTFVAPAIAPTVSSVTVASQPILYFWSNLFGTSSDARKRITEKHASGDLSSNLALDHYYAIKIKKRKLMKVKKKLAVLREESIRRYPLVVNSRQKLYATLAE